jgi:hypothetical protein
MVDVQLCRYNDVFHRKYIQVLLGGIAVLFASFDSVIVGFSAVRSVLLVLEKMRGDL